MFMSLIAYLILVLGIYYNDGSMANTPQAVRYIVLGIFESLLLLPLLLYVLGNGKSIKHAFRLRFVSMRALKDILFISIGMFIVLEYFQYVLAGWYGMDSFVSGDLKVLYPLNYFLLIPVFSIITPIVEEFVFRGYFLRVMTRNNVSPALAVIIQALVFTAAHLSFRNAPVVFVAGIILGFLAYSFHSIVPGIIIHSIFNTLALVNINFPRIEENIVYSRSYVQWLIIVGGFLLLTIGLVSVKKNVKVHRHRRDAAKESRP
jgi:membrane protease YdiL (CAAX protease family)